MKPGKIAMALYPGGGTSIKEQEIAKYKRGFRSLEFVEISYLAKYNEREEK